MLVCSLALLAALSWGLQDLSHRTSRFDSPGRRASSPAAAERERLRLSFYLGTSIDAQQTLNNACNITCILVREEAMDTDGNPKGSRVGGGAADKAPMLTLTQWKAFLALLPVR